MLTNPHALSKNASLVLLTYNQESTVEDAANSCLSQTCEPIQIIFSDDCSTDSTFEILSSLVDSYTGPHSVVLRKNEKNLGIADHYNELVKLVKSDFIIIAAGDDISLPNRAQKLIDAWNKSDRQLDLISSFVTDMSRDGKLQSVIKTSHLEKWKTIDKWCKKRPHVIGATFAFSKRLFSFFGNLNYGVDFEDQVLSFRCTALGGGYTIKEPLVLYRKGGVSSGEVNDKLKLIEQARKKYTRQLAVYTQIRQDLVKLGKPELARKKVSTYILKSELCLKLIDIVSLHSFSELILFVLKQPEKPNLLWSLSRMVYIKYPSIPFFLRKKI